MNEKLRKKILVCEDDESIMTPLLFALRASGYYVIQAVDGMESVEKVKSEKPDLVILDIIMPYGRGSEYRPKGQKEKEGIYVLKDIRKLKYKRPIIMLTVKAHDKMECLEEGANDYITKPFTLKFLLERVEELINMK